MFTHKLCSIELVELNEKTIHGIRYYEIDGELFPSVTSILSIQSTERLEIWRKNMGAEVANYESRRSAERGKIFHQICEDYLNNKDVYKHQNKVLSFALFNMIKKHVDRIDNIYKIEQKLYSKKYKIAGRTDCIAEFDGLLSIIDFKTSNRSKSPDLLMIHSIQETAYAIMWEELTGMLIDQIVTLVSCENGETQIHVTKPHFFKEKLNRCIKEFLIHQKFQSERESSKESSLIV